MSSNYSILNIRESASGASAGFQRNRWTMLGPAFQLPTAQPHKRYHEWWAVFRCDCGTIKAVRVREVVRQCSRSCGCLTIETARTNTNNLIHGSSQTPLYGVWCAVKRRCHLKSSSDYKNYGGRGIKVCNEWIKFPAFQKWAIDEGYAPGLQIDRIDNNGNYEPSNCHWVDLTTNARNKRTSIIITAFGERKHISEWVLDSRCVCPAKTLRWRLCHNWPSEKAITHPVRFNPRWHNT